jgi:virulence-associated protein VapD
MYAIAFDFDITNMQAAYQQVTESRSYNNGYAALRDEPASFGFTRQQGSLYYGGG